MIKFSRNSAVIINNLLNNFLPPFIRDSKTLMYPLFKMAFNKKASLFMDFRKNAYHLTEEAYVNYYKETEDSNLLKGTDLNSKCFNEILKNTIGKSVLEVGCGRGKLLLALSKNHQAIGCDIFENKEIKDNQLAFVLAASESLPFEDNAFDTVICTHVLEHVRDLKKSIDELKRVCKSRLIIVVPCERPYKFGFNLHLSFFPYDFNLLGSFFSNIKQGKVLYKKLDGDWYYQEEFI